MTYAFDILQAMESIVETDKEKELLKWIVDKAIKVIENMGLEDLDTI